MEKQQTNRASTIRNDPFAVLIPDPEEIKSHEAPNVEPPAVSVTIAEEPRQMEAKRVQAAKPVQGGIVRDKLTIHLDETLVNRVKNAAYWNPRLTITKIAERGIRHALAQVEKEHGGPYPQRESELTGGRSIR